jgi:hypothetical protein
MDEMKKVMQVLMRTDPREPCNQERIAVRVQDAHSLNLQAQDGAERMREILILTRAWFNEQQVCRRVHDIVVQIFEYWHQFSPVVALDPNCELPDMFVIQDPMPEPELQPGHDYLREQYRAIRENLGEALSLLEAPGRAEHIEGARELLELASTLVEALMQPPAAQRRWQHSDELELLMNQDVCLYE